MSISPKKHRPLSRVQSSPSLAVGIPVPYPDFDIMNPSSSTKSLKRSRSKPHIHRGDVSSSAASSPYNSEDEDVFNTPKRKVVGVIEPATVGRQKAGSRETLQARLQQAAKLKKSRSIGDGLGSSSSITHILEASQSTTAKVKATTQVHHGGESSDKSDKVVVCVRIKPTNSEFATKAYECTAASLSLSNSHPNVQKRGGKSGREDEYTYTFDKLLQYPSRTPDLYEAKIAPLVEKTMNGFNSTIFAYGQTGSGKSHTMTGTDSELGIIPCAVDGVFDSINAELDRAYLLRVSYIEIYNETLRDLLNFKKGPLKDEEKPVIHTAKGKVYVEPLVEQVVSTPQEVVELLAKGNACRKTGATDWNERSSRSHSVFTITVESRPRDGNGDDDIRVSRLNLIDLAGSEKAVSDLERRGEGKHINRSLLALREVINKLTEKKRTHVPYRDSKLTHLLENALGGDSNICVICTMSADEEHSSETLETLKFAGRCSQVETKAKKNIIMSDDRALIKAKDREIEVLKRRLDAIASASTSTSTSSAHDSAEQIAELADSVAAMEARKTVLSTKLARLNAEIITSEMPRSVAGLSATPIKPKRRRISEFAGPLGLGSPRRVVNDRRAVSNMSRLTEEVETTTATITTLESTISVSQSSSFDLERTIASLRRQLASKETELETLNDELTSALGRLGDLHEINLRIVSLESDIDMLQTDHAALLATKEANEEDHRSQMRDLQIQLESTRAELVGTISDKAAKMDQLESAILDLRQSREDLLVEDQQKLDEMTSRVEQLQRDKLQLEDQLKEGLGSKVELQSKFDSLVRDHSSAKESFEREASELRSTVEIVTQERDQASQVVLGLQDTRTKLQSEIDTLIATTKFTKELHQTELAQAKDAVAVAIRENVDKSEVIRALQEQLARLQEEHNALQGAHETCQVDKDSLRHDLAQSILEKETAQRSRQEAQDDLERFQRASMAEETKVVAELREELAKARKAREEDTAKLQADLHGLERAIEEEKQLGASSLREAQKDKDAVLSQHALELERRDQLEKDSYRDAEDLRKLLKAATDEKAAAAGALEAYKREVQASESAIMAELRKELASAQTAREEAMAQLEKAESASTNALQSQGEHQRRVEEQLQASKQELEAERKQSEEMAQAHASEIASLKVLVTEGAAGIDQLQQQLKQSREDGSQLSAQSSKHLSDLERLRNELSTKLVAANEEKETLRQTMEDVKTELQQAQTALETDRSRLAEAAELSDSLRQKLESREQQFITNLQQIQQSVESQKRAHVEAERQLESTKAVLAEVSGSKDEMAGKVAALEIDCAALRGALDRSQTELVESQKTVAESAEKATALAKQVAELQASISVTTTDTRTRQTVSASEPSMRSTVVVETLRTPALTTASTGDGAHSPAAMLRTKENEEIDRLEKVVEAQKIVIEEQREKILYWSRELEQQREIVQRLTQDPNDRTPPSRLRSSPRLSHSKSRSVGGYDSPSALPATRKPFPSTFTAFNLALPTTPTPLPAHPTQISNSSSRKGRRLTIEHDIDKLADSSKVNLARAMFDQPSLQPQSPTKTPTGHKRTTSLLASAPRQRRP